MKYSNFRFLVLGTLAMLFSAGILFYHAEFNGIMKKHLVDDMRVDIYELNYALTDDIYNGKLESFINVMDNYLNTTDMFRSISVLDKSRKVLISTDRDTVGNLFTGELKEIRGLNANSYDKGSNFYIPVIYNKSNGRDIYYLVISPQTGSLQHETLNSIHRTLSFFGVFVAVLMGLVLVSTQKMIVEPIKLMIEYTGDRKKVPPRFYIKEFEKLRQSMTGYIDRLIGLQEYSRTILDSQQDLVIITSGNTLLDANRAFLDFFGYETVEEFNKSYACVCELFENYDKPEYICRKDGENSDWLIKASENPLISYRVRITKNGIPFTFGINAGHMRFKDFDRYVVVLTDVTLAEGYKENLEILIQEEINKRAKSEARYQYLFNSLADGVCIHSYDEKGMPSEYIEVNDRMTEMFGYAREELLSMKPMQLHRKEDIENMTEGAAEIYKPGNQEFESVLVKKNGEQITCKLNSRLLDYYGQKTVFTTIKDITDKKMLEIQMKEQEKLLIQQTKLSTLGEMLGFISHQWKQPLNVIALISEHIRSTFNDNNKDAELAKNLDGYFDQIDGQVRFMAQTIDDFKNFYKPSKEVKTFSASALISEVYNMLKAQYKTHGMVLYLLKDDNIKDWVTGFPSEFKQVIMNLLSNTADVIEERKKNPEYKNRISGDITIKIENREEKVVISYNDSGGGIPADIMDRMFQPYNTSKGEKGVGIGMHISRQIVENMGGGISVENTENGVRFVITLNEAKKM